MIKTKFQTNWHLVRKAFLDNDTNGDGFISIDEFTKFLHGERTPFRLDDLQRLINLHSSNKDGHLTYSDFCNWIGTSIHMNEGFYFRHDSQVRFEPKKYADAYKKSIDESHFNDVMKQ